MNKPGRVLAVLFVIAIPLFLVTTSVTWAMNDLRLYHYGFRHYHVAEATGIEEGELRRAARQIRGYFNSTGEPLVVRVRVQGEERELFNQREVRHMGDVKHLVWGVYGVQGVTGLYLLGYIVAGLFRLRGPFLRPLARRVLWGGGLAVALVAVVGLASWASFDALFLLFHRISFTNDLWQLDPQRDYLVQMFPRGFWFDATLFVGLATVAMAVALGATSGAYLALGRRLAKQETPVGEPEQAEEGRSP